MRTRSHHSEADPRRDGESSTCALNELRPGERGRIVATDDTAADEQHRRLLARLQNLGFVPGAVVEPHRRAPMKDPTVYRIADYELALRGRDAATITVTRLADEPAGED
ncbi:FeoA family protein [Corynebacterium frankenforstense]|nr:FeoA family protein [Corynebacterium frankenforstense]